MKKILRTLILAVFVVPVMLFATACGGDYEYTPPNYEIVDGDYEFHANRGHWYDNDGYGHFSYTTYDDIEDTIDKYLVRLEDEYYFELEQYEEYGIYDMQDDDDNWIYRVLNLFIDGQTFTLSVLDDEVSMFEGVMTVDDPVLGDLFYLDFTVDQNDGEMTVYDDEGDYEDSVIEYEYADGTITVTVDVAWIIESLARDCYVPDDYDDLIPALWVRFDLQ